MTPGLGGGLGGGTRNRQKQYFVIPKPRQIDPNDRPDRWVVVKGFNETSANSVSSHSTKQEAVSRGKELARKNSTALTAFDAAKKMSNTFNYS